MAYRTDAPNHVMIGNQDYRILAEQEDGGGDYAWGMAALIRSDSGQLFAVADGGCSCYGPWDGVTTSMLIPVPSWQAAVDVLKAETVQLFNDDDYAKFAEQLMKLSPAPSKV